MQAWDVILLIWSRIFQKKGIEKYFIKTGTQLEIIKPIREKIVFSNHNILRDPPFIRMDLISCRNLLIYMKTKIQRKITLTLQFGLKLNGYLFLGNSENVGDIQTQFQVIDSRWRIYKNISNIKILPSQLQSESRLSTYHLKHPFFKDPAYGIPNKSLPETVFNRHIAESLAPSCIYIDKDFNVLFINGEVNDYIRINRGLLQQDLLKMLVNENLAAMVRNGVRRLREGKKPIVFNGVNYTHNRKNLYVNLKFQFAALESFSDDLILIIFAKPKDIRNVAEVYDQYKLDEYSKQRLEDLEKELQQAKQETQNVIEELETSNEELQASNEELQASNEELQSTNEELQSVNEELYTVNSELQAKNKELYDVNNDLTNVIHNTKIALLFLNKDLKIRMFTPELKRIFNLEEKDIGRSISGFASNFINITGKEIATDVEKVISTSLPLSRELKNEEGKLFLKRITPYKVNEKTVEGAVITFIDITDTRKKDNEFKDVNQRLELAMNIGKLAWWDWDFPSGHVEFSDAKAYMLGYKPP
ncbi:MAG: hypothetical protein HC906_01040 [Bacteroidales bacterium]|nr:hypothetical protein [Bacteroidales bacterium]